MDIDPLSVGKLYHELRIYLMHLGCHQRSPVYTIDECRTDLSWAWVFQTRCIRRGTYINGPVPLKNSDGVIMPQIGSHPSTADIQVKAGGVVLVWHDNNVNRATWIRRDSVGNTLSINPLWDRCCGKRNSYHFTNDNAVASSVSWHCTLDEIL